MRLAFNFFLILISFVINFSFFELIKLNGVKPNLFLIIIICISVLRDDIESALIGFFLGLTQDIFFYNKLGFFSFFYLITGYLANKPFKYFYRENYFVPMLLVFLSSVFFESLVFVFSFDFSLYKYFFYALIKIILPEAFYNVILIFIIYPVIYFINKKLETREIKIKQRDLF